MLLDALESQVVLIDYQVKLMPAMLDQERVQANALLLAKVASLMEVPVWGTEQNPTRLGGTVPELKVHCQHTLSKMHFSAVADGLVDRLRPPPKPPSGNSRSMPKHLQKAPAAAEAERNTIVLGGCEAHVCLLQTALQLMEQEFDVWVVTDACSSRTERNRDAAFDRLAGSGVELVTTEMVVFEWLQSCEHPAFREVLALVK